MSHGLSNQQQLDCLLKHMENSQNLNLWNKQTQQQAEPPKREKRIQIITPNSSPRGLSTLERKLYVDSLTSSERATSSKPKSEWVVQPVFVDIVKLALKIREDCSTRQVIENSVIQ